MESELAQAEGLVGVRFRPVAARRDADDIRGVLWLDAHDYRARHLDLEWVRGAERSAVGRLDYADVPVPGGTLRLPTGGRLAIEQIYGAAPNALISGAASTLTFTYEGFAPAAAR